MELTKQEQILIKKIRTAKEDESSSVLAVKYIPLGETGHTQTLLYGSRIPITSIRKSLVHLLKDIKQLYKEGYTVLIAYDHLIDALTIYEMKSIHDINSKTPISLTKSYHKEK